ncbi:MAG: mobile mystery protein B [Candidatus Nanopelagicaceae bacterium]
MNDIPRHSFDDKSPIPQEESEHLLLNISTQGELNLAEAENLDKALLKFSNLKRKKTCSSLLKVSFAKKLHKECFGNVWNWAGKFRKISTQPGIYWREIPSSLDLLMKNTLTKIDFIPKYSDIEYREKIIAEFAYRLVYIHPFRNGNGRWSRAYADILADSLNIKRFGWGLSITKEVERHTEMVNSLQLADFTNNIDPFLDWAKK